MLGRVEKAILRSIGDEVKKGLSTDPNHSALDVDLAQRQHARYVQALKEMGLTTTVLHADERYPDGTFVEDTHVVTPEFIIQMRPGALSRRGEVDGVQAVLPNDRPYITLPTDMAEMYTIDGGDVLRMGQRLYIGISSRTTEQAVQWLKGRLDEYGYQVIGFPLPDGLHLKSSVTGVEHGVFVMLNSFATPWQSLHEKLDECVTIHVVPEAEKIAANVMAVDAPKGKYLVMPKDCPITFEFVKRYYPESQIICVDESELNKIDGAITCKSLLY